MSGGETTAPIDMTRTWAPQVPAFREHVERSLIAAARAPDLASIIQRHRFHGSPRDKQAGADWLSNRLGAPPNPTRLLMTGGTQNTLMVLFSRLAQQGAAIAAEKLTYAAIGQLAMLGRISVLPVDIDEDGMRDDSLESLCKAHNLAAVYINPTGHNPTTSMMSLERRQKVVRVARKYALPIIEDDVHGLIANNAPPPLASIAPDLTWYLMSVSKCLGIGLRTAYLIAPSDDGLADLLRPIPSVSSWFVPGLSAAIITHLIESGAASHIVGQISKEIAARQDIAQEMLGHLGMLRTNKSSLHVWIDLPSPWTAEPFIQAARTKGVILRHPRVFATPGTNVEHNIRASLIAPSTHEDLRRGLSVLATLLLSRT
ncbi:PLP-dependent aminotransferase family protein [Bradyrhizobium vignae]|uniref:aminotransferase-like domain-containing protein n=1 Tax=Bradyrhizobium vignae TaxID=1549949 RepID=UPI00100B3258|nr:PLP-dependent aminotransferase family protein [Bradyrhizobium vignae]RXG84466.1 PLP-dependent aminotransferase family protein [Bradyrhizobium vignae]